MTLFQLRIFSMATRMSFQKVAEQLYISPSSVTKYISSLESELEKPLFIRDRNKVMLSEFGKDFLPYANDILEKEDAAIQFIGTRSRQQQTLSVGIDLLLREERWDHFYIPLIQAKNSFIERNQEWNILYKFLGFPELRIHLNKGKTDFSLVEICNSEFPATLAPGFNALKILQNNYILVIPANVKQGYALTGSLTEDLLHVESVSYINDPASKKLALDFSAEFRTVSKLVPVSHWGEILMKMASGESAALLPEKYRDIATFAKGKVYSLPSEKFSTGIYAIWREDHNGEKRQEFLDLLQKQFEECVTNHSLYL